MAKKNSSILWTVYQSGGNNTADVIGNQGRITAQDNIGLGDGFIKATETHKYVTNVSRDANSGKLLVNVAQPTLSDLQGMGSNSANKAIVTAGDNDIAQNGTLIAKTLTATKVSSDSTTNVFVSGITGDGQGNITFTTKTLSTATTSAIGGVKSTTTGTTSGRDYYVQVESNGQMKVNVPWENNTHYDSKTVICNTNNGMANTAVTTSETVYLNHVEHGAVQSSHKILGTNCNITADSSGHLTIAPVITAGSNVSINSSNVISATDTTYTAGSGVTLTGTTFSADKTVMQEKLTAGSNVQISNSNVISATDTTYTAGANIQISSNNVISATSQVQSDWAQTDNTQVGFIVNKPKTKYWFFDLNGYETTTWASIGPTSSGSSGASVNIPIQWDDQGTLGREQLHTNFTPGHPEAFPLESGSSRIVLKRGLWRYTMYVDLEPTTPGTGVTDMSMWVRMMSEGVANYITVRRISMPISNGVQARYTRTLTGTLYIDADPTYSGVELSTYRAIRFDVDIMGACDAVYRFRQNSLMLERIGV